MKVWLFNIIFLVAIIGAVLAFREKTQQVPDEIDEFSHGLADLRSFIGDGSVITFNSLEKPVEHLIWSRYFLFPARIDRIQDAQNDTSLVILSRDASDSTVSSIIMEGQVHWTNMDDKYRYLLISDAKN